MEIFNIVFDKNWAFLLTKIFFVVISLLFTLFLLVVFRQVQSLNTLINDANDSIILKTVALILLLSSVSLFLAALVIL